MPTKRQLFPEKLWQLVDQPSSGIQWSQDGKRIEVNRALLESYDRTKFRSHNFDSFIRQLHFYGFRKTGNSYYHDQFQKGKPEALLSMKRKYSNSSINKPTVQTPPVISAIRTEDTVTKDNYGPIDLSSHKNPTDRNSPLCRHRLFSSQTDSKSPSKIISKQNQWFKIEIQSSIKKR